MAYTDSPNGILQFFALSTRRTLGRHDRHDDRHENTGSFRHDGHDDGDEE